jgi:hypothetical protein
VQEFGVQPQHLRPQLAFEADTLTVFSAATASFLALTAASTEARKLSEYVMPAIWKSTTSTP